MQALKMDQNLKALVKTERKITYEILLLIQAFDITKSYRELGYSSLFEYLVKEIGYSESAAQRRISSARLMKQVPGIETDLQSGKLNLTQVSLAYSAIRQEEKAQGTKVSSEQKNEILRKLKSKNTFESQKVLLEELPNYEPVAPKAIPQKANQVYLTLQMSEKDWQKIQALLAHFSHKVPDQRLESLLLYFADQMEMKKRAQEKKVQIQSKSMPREQPRKDGNGKLPDSPKISKETASLPLRQWKNGRHHRKYIPAHISATVFAKARHQCQFVSQTGRRCSARHFLEIEHCVPLARGGTDGIQNLRVYCRSHNQLAAKREGLTSK